MMILDRLTFLGHPVYSNTAGSFTVTSVWCNFFYRKQKFFRVAIL